jgi:8-oxo-dGTP pyrophosphatase MutT (NUDIX family)
MLIGLKAVRSSLDRNARIPLTQRFFIVNRVGVSIMRKERMQAQRHRGTTRQTHGGIEGQSRRFLERKSHMPDEFVNIIDEKGRIIGEASKAEVHRRGLRHRVAAVLLQGEDGKYLIPTASRIKAEAGLLYHSAAGHVLSGESDVDSARRELREETGLSADHLEYLGAFWFEKEYSSRTEKESFRVYQATYRKIMGPVRLNEEQVNEQWLSAQELAAIYRDKRERISAPLLMTCEHILGFESGSKG